MRDRSADKLANEALTRVLALEGSLQPTQAGTNTGQDGGVTSFQVFGQTVGAATQTVDTGFKPPPGHAAKVDGGLILVDRTANTSSVRNTNGNFYNNAGTVAAHGAAVVSGGIGDGSLTTATITFTISGTNTIEVVFTPPGGYAGTLEWVYNVTFSVN